MSNRAGLSAEEKLVAVKDIVEGRESLGRTTRNIGVSRCTVKDWLRKYDESGIEGLKDSHTWKRYSTPLKEQAVQDVLHRRLSSRQIVKKYGISSRSVLRHWVSKYTSGKELKSTSKGTSTTMHKGRKTTFKERLEIVQYTLANDLDYQRAAVSYRVSYQQVYT